MSRFLSSSWKPWEGFQAFPRWASSGKARRPPTRLCHLLALPTLLLALSGCVVPLGPQWTDPQSNVPPTIYSAYPPIGSTLSADAGADGTLDFQVVLADQNTQDALYARWIVDYPPWDDATSRVALRHAQPGGTEILRPSITYVPSCVDDTLSHESPNHRLLLAVSDRPFAFDPSFSQSASPDAVPSGNFLVEGSWDFTLPCP